MQENNQNQTTSKNTLLKGSAWMTMGSIFSRILGALYIIPWFAWMGSHGNIANALTARSYNIYSLFIIISTAGIPGAIAKQVAHYNALNEYGVGRKLFHRGIMLMLGLGVISTIAMYYFSPLLAGDDPRQIQVMQSLSAALLLIPVMSLIRGYFQGYNDMAPAALSQFVEQLFRVIYMLGATYIIMKLHSSGDYVLAVTHSTFAAAVGALAGLALLIFYYYKKKSQMDYLVLNSDNAISVSTGKLFKEIVRQSIPFIIIDSGITLFQLIDQYTFNQFMGTFVKVSTDQLDSWYALFGLNANKLIMITISLATAMAVTAIPLLSGAHARKNFPEITAHIGDTLELFLFVMIPSSFGMAAVATSLYSVFYNYDALGISVLYLSSFVAIALGLFTILAAILQGLSRNRLAILYLIVGIVIKLVLQYPLIALFKIYGPLVATGIGMSITSWLMLHHLKVRFRYSGERTKRRFAGIVLFSVFMFIPTKLVESGLIWLMRPDGKLGYLLVFAVSVIVGAVIYGYLVLKTRLADRIIGSKVEGIRRRLKIS